MKRWIALLLAVLLIAALTGCRGGSDAADAQEPEGTEGVTLVDNDACRIRITGMFRDQFFGNTLKVEMTNKSRLKSYDFSVLEASVNGLQWNPYFVKEVGPGKTVTGDMQFTNPEYDTLIPEFTDVELFFSVSDTNSTEKIFSETFHYYPLGKEKATVYTREQQPDDVVLADNNVFKATVTGYACDSVWGGGINLFLENKSDVEIMFGALNVAVNGEPCDPFWGTSLKGHTATFEDILFLQSDFDAAGIQTMESVEITLVVYDADSFGGRIFEETFTLHP